MTTTIACHKGAEAENTTSTMIARGPVGAQIETTTVVCHKEVDTKNTTSILTARGPAGAQTATITSLVTMTAELDPPVVVETPK